MLYQPQAHWSFIVYINKMHYGTVGSDWPLVLMAVLPGKQKEWVQGMW
jgi:hypothetical protein